LKDLARSSARRGLPAYILLLSAISTAHAQDQTRSDWFKSLLQPGTEFSCCDISDCRRTEARWERGQWWAEIKGTWRPIPATAVVNHPISIDGDAYVCASNINDWRIRIDPVIYCFVPPHFGS
jgi:hypothetical protein